MYYTLISVILLLFMLCVPILIKAANLFIYNYPNLLWPHQLKYTENQIEMLILKVLQIARLQDNL